MLLVKASAFSGNKKRLSRSLLRGKVLFGLTNAPPLFLVSLYFFSFPENNVIKA